MLTLVFLICAFICFLLGAVWTMPPTTPPTRINFIALGLAFYMLFLLLQIHH